MTPYEILGVATDAAPEQIKKAYRKLAMQHHPDKNADSPESIAKFREIQEAYDTLTKPNQNNRQNEQGDPFGGGFSPFSDGFAWAFRDQPPRNADYQAQAAITLEEAYAGTELSLTIRDDKILTIKVPKGAFHGMRMTLQGEGSHDHAHLPPGNLHLIIGIRPHPVFQSNGHDLFAVTDVDAIDLMLGTEIAFTTLGGETLNITIPAGSSQRTRLRIGGKGMPQGDRFGDLYIQVNPVFPKLSDAQIEKLREIKTIA